MVYNYFCEECDKTITKECKMGDAPKDVECLRCGNKGCYRIYNSVVRVPNPTHEARRRRGRG